VYFVVIRAREKVWVCEGNIGNGFGEEEK